MSKPSKSLPLYPEQVRQLILPEAKVDPSRRHTIGLGAYAFDARRGSGIELAAHMAPGLVELQLRADVLPFAGQAPRAEVRRPSLDQARPPRGRAVIPLHRPAFLPARSIPAAEDLRARYFGKAVKRLNPQQDRFFDQPLDIPDTRYAYFDTAYPWSAFGRVRSGGHGTTFSASGAMVGPRHVLISSGAVGWHGDALANWLEFTPCYSHGRTPFGSAYAEIIYAWRQVPLLYRSSDEELKALNYAVAVLKHRLGDTTGWIGTRIYEPGWDGADVWSMSAYNMNFSSAQEPVFQDRLRLGPTTLAPGTDPAAPALAIGNNAKEGGLFNQLGASLFGWWPGEVGPSTVGVYSYFDFPDKPAIASGGAPMFSLIQLARAEFP